MYDPINKFCHPLAQKEFLWWGFAGLPLTHFNKLLPISFWCQCLRPYCFTTEMKKKSKRIDWLEMSSEHDFPFPLMTRTQQVSVCLSLLALYFQPLFNGQTSILLLDYFYFNFLWSLNNINLLPLSFNFIFQMYTLTHTYVCEYIYYWNGEVFKVRCTEEVKCLKWSPFFTKCPHCSHSVWRSCGAVDMRSTYKRCTKQLSILRQATQHFWASESFLLHKVVKIIWHRKWVALLGLAFSLRPNYS